MLATQSDTFINPLLNTIQVFSYHISKQFLEAYGDKNMPEH